MYKFDAAIRLNPGDAVFHREKGNLLASQEEIYDAMVSFAVALLLDFDIKL